MTIIPAFVKQICESSSRVAWLLLQIASQNYKDSP